MAAQTRLLPKCLRTVKFKQRQSNKAKEEEPKKTAQEIQEEKELEEAAILIQKKFKSHQKTKVGGNLKNEKDEMEQKVKEFLELIPDVKNSTFTVDQGKQMIDANEYLQTHDVQILFNV